MFRPGAVPGVSLSGRYGRPLLEPCGEGELTVSLHYDGAYGMGEKYNAVNQKGHTAVNEVEEKFCFQGEKTYCPAFLLDKYGLRAICGHG